MRINELMERLETLQDTILELEKDLLRDLTDEEFATILKEGRDYFVHNILCMNEQEYQALKDLKTLICAYCTQTQEDYDKVLDTIQTKEIIANALQTIVNDLRDKIVCLEPELPFEEDPAKLKATHSESGTELKACRLADILNMLPKSSSAWVKYFDNNIKDYKEIIEVLKAMEEESDEAICGEVLDTIKDAVIADVIEKLRNGAESIELDHEIIEEVVSTVWEEEDNVRISVKDNNLSIEFK